MKVLILLFPLSTQHFQFLCMKKKIVKNDQLSLFGFTQKIKDGKIWAALISYFLLSLKSSIITSNPVQFSVVIFSIDSQLPALAAFHFKHLIYLLHYFFFFLSFIYTTQQFILYSIAINNFIFTNTWWYFYCFLSYLRRNGNLVQIF